MEEKTEETLKTVEAMVIAIMIGTAAAWIFGSWFL
jgi:hypothetical protein